MLSKEDLQLMQEMMVSVVQTAVQESAERTKREIKAYLENGVEKNMQILMEGHRALNEKLDRILDRVETAENLEPRVTALEVKVKENSADIAQLKQA